MTYRFKLTDIFKFKDYSVRSNRVEHADCDGNSESIITHVCEFFFT